MQYAIPERCNQGDKAVIDIAIENPALGPVRVSNELKLCNLVLIT